MSGYNFDHNNVKKITFESQLIRFIQLRYSTANAINMCVYIYISISIYMFIKMM